MAETTAETPLKGRNYYWNKALGACAFAVLFLFGGGLFHFFLVLAASSEASSSEATHPFVVVLAVLMFLGYLLAICSALAICVFVYKNSIHQRSRRV